jgi:hypothetical protein
MRTTLRIPVLLLALAGAAGPASGQSNGGNGGLTYRWVDKNGQVHYGDSVPPKYASDSREILNSQGVEIAHVDGPKTAAQLAAEESARAKLQAQKQHDYFLLSTYTSVQDIESLRDERLSQLEAQQTAARQYVQSLQARLTSLQDRAMKYKPYNSHPNAPRMPDDLAQELVQTLNEVRVQNQAMAERTQQESQVRAQFQSDIDRFQQLKASPP